MKTEKLLNDPKYSRLLFLACWLVYTSAYIGRNTFAASIVTLTGKGVLTESQAGLIGTFYFICYGTGHLINGILADRLSPFTMIRAGLLGSAVCNLIMPLCGSYPVMLVTWSVNGFLQSMMWSPILFILSNIIIENQREKSILGMQSTVPGGTILAYLSAALTARASWSVSYYVASGVLVFVFVVFSAVSAKASKRMTELPAESLVLQANTSNEKGGAGFLPILLSSGALFLLLPVLCHGMLKDGVLTWVPSLIKSTYNVSDSLSTFLTILLPFAGLCGSYISDFMYHRVFRKNEAATGLFFMLLTVIPILFVLQMSKMPLAVNIVCLAFISMFMTSFNYMFSTVLPTRFTFCHKTATLSGIFNSTIYLGSAISSYGFGSIAEKSGWSVTVAVWLGIAAVGAFCLILLVRPWGKFIRRK